MLGAMHKQCATHMPVAMHERTNELTDAEPTHPARDDLRLSNAREHEQIYLVRWAAEGIVKAGFSSDGKRWRSFIRRGARLMGVAALPRQDRGFDAASAEYLLHLGLARHLPRAFGHRSEAVGFLGHKGAGWTECYVDDGSLALPMFALAVDVIRSERPDTYWLVRNHWEQPAARECRLHRGQIDGHCGPCRSEQIGAA